MGVSVMGLFAGGIVGHADLRFYTYIKVYHISDKFEGHRSRSSRSKM